MALELTRLRCFNHRLREAAARCRECGRCFCRECVTEHGGQVVCAGCLERVTAPVAASKPRRSLSLLRFGGACICIFCLWIMFYAAGQVLLLLGDEFHDGTVWERFGT